MVPIFYSTPVAGNGKVFMDSGYSALALDSNNGNIIWNYTAKDALILPTLFNNVLYIRGRDATLYALKAENGDEIWSYSADGGFSSALVVNGIVFAPCGDDQIYSLNAVSGANSGVRILSFQNLPRVSIQVLYALVLWWGNIFYKFLRAAYP